MAKEESNYPVEHPTWDKDVKNMFSDFDIEQMKKHNILLDVHNDVREMSSKIYQRVAEGNMPVGKPDKKWKPEKVATFYNWMNDGCP